MSVFTDDLVRKTVATQFEQDLFVEAAAGSGKTQALVTRAINLIAEGITTIDRIVIITFTESAADELRFRIRSQLETQIVGDESSGRRDRYNAALRAMDKARISTIHAFAKSVLESAGVFTDVHFVLDPSEERSIVRDWTFARLRERWGRDDVEALSRLELLQVFGVTSWHWLQFIETLHARWDRCRTISHSVPAVPSFVPRYGEVLDHVDAIISSRPSCRNVDDVLFNFIETQLVPWRRQAADSFIAQISALLAFPTTRKRMGNKSNWPADVLEENRAHWQAVLDAIDSQLSDLGEIALRWMLSEAGLVVLDMADSRTEQGLYSFHDLLVRCTDLLGDQTLLTEIARNISHVFVDEFQDTDPLQWEIVQRLTNEVRKTTAAPLFVVGDPRQSIYRFRGADIETFLSTREQVRGEVLALTTSFRSLPEVTTFINSAAAKMFSQSFVADSSLVPARNENETQGQVVIVDEVLDKDHNAEQVREFEANQVVGEIKQLLANGLVADVVTGAPRQIRLSDIALLMPTRTSLPATENALRTGGLHYRVESPILIWNTQELRDITNILWAIAEPANEVALLGALRSPYLACSDVDLLRFVRNGGTWNRQTVSDEAGGPVAEAMRTLNQITSEVAMLSVADGIEAVFARLGLFAIAASSSGSDLASRLSYVLHQARAFDRRPVATLAGFCRWARDQRDDGALAYEYPARLGDSDAIRVMTIHAAKGLEFPVVGLVGLQTRRPPVSGVRVLWHGEQPEAHITGRYGPLDTKQFAQCADAEKIADEQETLRLLYVGMTRARDVALISLIRSERGGGSFAKTLADILA